MKNGYLAVNVTVVSHSQYVLIFFSVTSKYSEIHVHVQCSWNIAESGAKHQNYILYIIVLTKHYTVVNPIL